MKSNLLRFLTVGFSALALSATAEAAIFSVQFAGGDGPADPSGGRSLLASDTAGIEPATHWNAVFTSQEVAGSSVYVDGGTHTLQYFSGYNQFNGQNFLPAPVNDSGIATTIVGTISGFTVAGQVGASTASPVIANQKLMSHEIAVPGTQFGSQAVQTGTLAFSNLHANGFTTYDVIAYLNLNASSSQGGGHPSTITLNGGTPVPLKVDGGASYQNPVVFVDATTLANGGNYVRFNGLTGDSVSLAITSAPYFNAVGFSGIQIIQAVPEPASLGFLLVGGITLAGRRRRMPVAD